MSEQGLVTTEFIAAVLVNKYCDHLPVYRQVRRMFKNMKRDIVVALVARGRRRSGRESRERRCGREFAVRSDRRRGCTSISKREL